MKHAKWIVAPCNTGAATVSFKKKIKLSGGVKHALIRASSVGVYVLTLDRKKVGDRILAPGFTSYMNRTLYQEYDVTTELKNDSTLCISVGCGWAVGSLGFTGKKELYSDCVRAVCELEITYENGETEIIATDSSWEAFTHPVTFSDIYNGETVDYTVTPTLLGNAVEINDGKFPLAPDNGAPVKEQETFKATLIVTPKGENVLDFGQNMTGYVSLKIKGDRGKRVVLSHAEVLDSDGNFYNANYRTAQNKITYILSGGADCFKPQFSFQGFRYVRIDEYPSADIDVEGFTAIVVHTEMERIGYFECGNEKINQLYHNIIWGQKSNYLDIPTDCPQRDERLGWTGDAQVFCRTAAINYDVRKFFDKWLADLRVEQGESGEIYGTCPEQTGMHRREHSRISAAWGDIATVAPWTLYEIYGDKKILEDNFEMMRLWVEYMHSAGSEEYLWLGGYHYGDWLAMDAGGDSYAGATSTDLIATAYFAYSTGLLIKAGEVLGKDMSEYESMYENILKAFRKYFKNTEMTQTALTLMLHFELCKEKERPLLADKLCELIEKFGGKMSTGFVGTPYILHALSDNGKADVAYKLLFNEESPSWLYSVNHGATTMWEHWNGIKEDGSFWSTDMNSFNHYAYGAVGDWLYGAVSGIKIDEAGYKEITIKPIPDKRLGYAKTTIETPNGTLISEWHYEGDRVKFGFTIPKGIRATIILPNGQTKRMNGGDIILVSGMEVE